MVNKDSECCSPSTHAAAKMTAEGKLAEAARESSCSLCPVSSHRFLPWLLEKDYIHK